MHRSGPDTDHARGGDAGARDYVFAAAATCAGVLVMLLVTGWLEDFPLLILLAVVMASALRGGAGPGFLATALSGVAILGAAHFLADAFRIPTVNLSDEVVRLVVFLVVATGISLLAGARRRAERERDALLVREHAARRQAEEASWAKDRLLAMVSHELRNPLAAILSWSSLLRGAATDPERAARALEVIERNARCQARLIDDLLDVSRFVNGRMRLDVRPTDLGTVVATALETIRPAAEAKQIQIDTALDPRTDLVMGDPDRLRQIVWNLVSNAVKFTPRGGRVSLRLRPCGGQAELEVADIGQGFEPDAASRMFDPFWQADSGSNRPTAGLGLGLVIVRRLVELHGGTVTAHSAGPGRGAHFRVTIPLLDAGDAAVGADRPR